MADGAKVKKWRSQAREYAERAEAAAARAEAAVEQLRPLSGDTAAAEAPQGRIRTLRSRLRRRGRH